MALLDEEIVEYWLNNKGFFCMRGVKSGLGEIDFLALRPTADGFETWHVEVQVSFRPIGYVGGDTSAKRRTDDQVIEGVDQWIQKKYTDPKKAARRDEILPNVTWKMVLVCGELRHSAEADLMRERGIEVIFYSKIIEELTHSKSAVNSVAGNIIEIIRYLRKNASVPVIDETLIPFGPAAPHLVARSGFAA